MYVFLDALYGVSVVHLHAAGARQLLNRQFASGERLQLTQLLPFLKCF